MQQAEIDMRCQENRGDMQKLQLCCFLLRNFMEWANPHTLGNIKM